MVRILSVISSPTVPSPLVEARERTPFLYSTDTESPSILGSTTYFGSEITSLTLRSKSRSSSNEKLSCRLSILTSWTTSENFVPA